MLGLPIDWWVIIGCTFISLTTVLAVVAKKKQNKKNARPILRKILTIIPIAEGNSPQLGRAVPLIGQSEDTIRAFHPDWEDPDTQTMGATLELDTTVNGVKIVPLRYLDLDGKTSVEQHIGFDDGDVRLASITSLLAQSPPRPDRLIADPKKVGQYYARQSLGGSAWGDFFSRKNLWQLLTLLGFGIMFGAVTIGYVVWHQPPTVVHTP